MIKWLRDVLYYREQATYRFRQLVTQSVHTRWQRSEHLGRRCNDMLAHSLCAAEINAVPQSTLVTVPVSCGQLYHISMLAAERRIRWRHVLVFLGNVWFEPCYSDYCLLIALWDEPRYKVLGGPRSISGNVEGTVCPHRDGQSPPPRLDFWWRIFKLLEHEVKLTILLSACLIKHCTVMVYGKVEALLHVFLISALDGSFSLTSKVGASGIHCIWGCVNPRTGLNTVWSVKCSCTVCLYTVRSVKYRCTVCLYTVRSVKYSCTVCKMSEMSVHCPKREVQLCSWSVHCPKREVQLYSLSVHCPKREVQLYTVRSVKCSCTVCLYTVRSSAVAYLNSVSIVCLN